MMKASQLVICLSLLAASAEANDAVDRIFRDFPPQTPGCAVGVTRQGQLLYSKGYGAANLDYAIPLSAQSVFDIGSASKQFVVFSILLLEEQGKLTLEDEVQRYLPEIPQYGSPVRIRHLIHHTSGIRDYLTLLNLAGRDRDFQTPASVLRLLARQRETNFPPGSDQLYSNSGYFLLGLIVERVSGQSLARFAQDRIFIPLGMHDTHFQDDHREVLRHRATGYVPKPGGGFQVSLNPFDIVGDGGVYTTVEDLARWDRNFVTRELGSAAVWKKMLEPGQLDSGPEPRRELTYGGGLRITTHRGLPLIAHGGSWAGFRAEALRFPGESLGVICLCNTAAANPTELALRVAETYLDGKMAARSAPVAPPPAEPPVKVLSGDFSALTGTYRSDELDSSVEILLSGRDLYLRRSGTLRRLIPTGDRRFSDGPATITFEPAEGAVSGLRVGVDRVRGVLFVRSTSAAPFDVFAWVDYHRRLGAQSPGKQAYIGFLKERYGYQIAQLREAYGIDVQSFTELESFDWRALDRTRAAVRADDEAFGLVIQERRVR